ncbi:MAG: radical SAM protein [Candidatus Binatia bacterium]
MAGALSEKSFLTKFVDAGFTRIEVLETSQNKRTRNPEAYVVTIGAQKASISLRAPLKKTPKPVLNRENASETLKEFWVFPVAPETCNLACTHCLYAASPKTRNPYRLSASELSGVLAQIEALGAKPHFLFTGGEPTLHKELYDFLETIDHKGYSFQLMTNGTRIHRETAERLSKMTNLTKVQISLESADPKINDSIYGAGLQQRVLQAVDTLKEEGVAVTLAVTPMQINEGGLPAIEELAAEKGADVKYISLYDLGSATENGLKPSREVTNGDSQPDIELMCDKGVTYSEGAFYPCPVLVKEPGTKLGETLEQALSPEARRRVARLHQVHAACQVCLKGST